MNSESLSVSGNARSVMLDSTCGKDTLGGYLLNRLQKNRAVMKYFRSLPLDTIAAHACIFIYFIYCR